MKQSFQQILKLLEGRVCWSTYLVFKSNTLHIIMTVFLETKVTNPAKNGLIAELNRKKASDEKKTKSDKPYFQIKC